MYNPPTPNNLYKQRSKIEKEDRTIIWLTGCLYKNKRVRTTSQSIAEHFKSHGWFIEKADGDGYWITWPGGFDIDS